MNEQENGKIVIRSILGNLYTSTNTITNKHAEGESHSFYTFWQFKLPEEWEMGQKTPLIAYAAVYYNAKANIYRFCGSTYPENLEDELYKQSPHYFIRSSKHRNGNNNTNQGAFFKGSLILQY